ITPAVTVEILDQFGNLTSSSASVTMAIGTNPSGGTLSGTTTQTASGGIATFNDLSINNVGNGYTLTASSSGLTGSTSSSFNITAAASADLAVGMTGPGTASEGDTFTYTITVTNNGPNSASSTVLTDTLGANLKFVSATTSQGSFSQAGGVVTFTI